jgi:hypothetical protein
MAENIQLKYSAATAGGVVICGRGRGGGAKIRPSQLIHPAENPRERSNQKKQFAENQQRVLFRIMR